MPWFEDETSATAKSERQAVLSYAGLLTVLTLIHLCMVFAWARPENPFLCSLPRAGLALLWLMTAILAGVSAVRRRFPENRRLFLMTVVVAGFIAAYVGLRADNDVFTLCVRWHLWRAGGSTSVREAAEAWVTRRQAEMVDPRDDRPFTRIFGDSGVRVPADEPPNEVQYLRKTFPHDFYAGMDEKSLTFRRMGFSEADIRVYFPGAEAEEKYTFWERVSGSHRQVADGLTVRIRKSNR